MITLADIRAAQKVLAGHAHRTPVHTCRTLDRLAGRQIFFKCEQFQKVGAFKYRGACHAVQRLENPEKGVLTHSSGNHAQALALAAKERGVPAYIVMPQNASPVKRRAVADYGAQITLCAPNLEARETTASEIERRTGATLIPPYNHPHVIAGQATAALELLEDVPDLDALIAPVGGGGLLSGTAIAAEGRKVFAGEPTGADDAARSKAAGTFIPQTGPKTIADGLLTSMGDLTWPIIRDKVERIFTVSDAEIVAAMRLLWERAKLLVEPSAAVPFAALLTGAFREIQGAQRIGVILSGGNVNLDQLPWVE